MIGERKVKDLNIWTGTILVLLWVMGLASASNAGSICWKEDGVRGCIKWLPPSNECLIAVSLSVGEVEGFDEDRDGRITVNDLLLVASRVQSETEGVCGE